MARRRTRRGFLKASAVVTTGFWVGGSAPARSDSPNEKLNIGIVGVANRGADNLAGVAGQNIVALCDIDDNYLNAASEKYPKATRYDDFRALLDLPFMDAVVISTPDHVHAPASVMAMASGKHVYCEKPLAHSVFEARAVARAADRYKRVTQMGTQIHAGDNYRRVVELVQGGAIGEVRECHVWCGKTWSGGERPTETPEVPASLHWDLWLGPAPQRPYHPTYLPANWRRWWDFGGGTIGDMGCHYMDLPFWALNLRSPEIVEANGPPPHPETTPEWLIVKYVFPPRGDLPPLHLTWYDGGKRPELFAQGKLPDWGDGVLFVGKKGMLIADYTRYKLLPEEDFADFKPPEPTIPKSVGHYQEWIDACRSGGKTTCNFDYSGRLTEAALLGNVAFRTGRKLLWDPINLRSPNCPEASQYIQREYRKGWRL